MRLIVEPDDGVAPLLAAIKSAQKSIEIVIFRFDRSEVERALEDAVERGVFVHALIAYTNRGGERNLRKLEMRLLAAGVTVARTADDLTRYHDKLMIIDRRILYLLAFNYTALDIDHSRSFGLITQDREFVQEAIKLFEADTTRQPYQPGLDTFVVSPENARPQLSTFIKGAQKQLLIYDPKIADDQMLHLLRDRAKAGVEIRVIGKLGKRSVKLPVQTLPKMRLHTRTIIRDGHAAFVGSQSLRKAELDKRREVGMITRDPKVVKRLLTIFAADWTAAELAKDQDAKKKEIAAPAAKAAEKVVEAIASDFPAPASIVKKAVKEAVKEAVKAIVAETGEVIPETKAVKEVIKEAVKEAVEEVVKEEAVKEAGPVT